MDYQERIDKSMDHARKMYDRAKANPGDRSAAERAVNAGKRAAFWVETKEFWDSREE